MRYFITFSMETKGTKVKNKTSFLFIATFILYILPLNRCYYIRHHTLEVPQIEAPLSIRHPERTSLETNDFQLTEDNPIPVLLLNSIPESVVDEDPQDYMTNNIYTSPQHYQNVEPMSSDFDQGMNYVDADTVDQIIDLPTGTPESEKEVPGEPLTPQDFENAEKLEILIPPQDEDSPDPILSAGLFEGDIAGVNISDFNLLEKNALRDLSKRWSGGIIPYVISSSFSLYERSVIAAAVLDFHARTCIRFVPRTIQRDYVHLVKGSGCSSLVGRFGGGQYVSLGPGCLYKGIVDHELMHACGFWHEQSRGDRDEYVTILWGNIMPGNEHNFQKFGWRVSQTLGVTYDTGSIMHYGRYAFSRDYRSPTILPRNPNAKIGQRRGFSQTDLLKINRLYECQGGITLPIVPTKPKPYECSDNNKFCQYWANTGECKRNPAWMKVNCANSCRLCGTDSKCGNYNRNCERWAQIGECTKNPDYMTIYCARACHSCRGVSGDNVGCKDWNRYCTAWAENGQCRANPNYMLSYCKKSCSQC